MVVVYIGKNKESTWRVIDPPLTCVHQASADNPAFAGLRQVNKNGKPNIAPLQLSTLATFRSWGNSTGAGRAGLPGGKDIRIFDFG
jgi:hypothetical protein